MTPASAIIAPYYSHHPTQADSPPMKHHFHMENDFPGPFKAIHEGAEIARYRNQRTA
jgi:hypothetical protein